MEKLMKHQIIFSKSTEKATLKYKKHEPIRKIKKAKKLKEI